MAKSKEMAELRNEDRVASEQVSASLRKGTTAKIDRAAKIKGTTRSAVIQEALENWIFRPRLGPPVRPAKRTGRAKPVRGVKPK